MKMLSHFAEVFNQINMNPSFQYYDLLDPQCRFKHPRGLFYCCVCLIWLTLVSARPQLLRHFTLSNLNSAIKTGRVVLPSNKNCSSSKMPKAAPPWKNGEEINDELFVVLSSGVSWVRNCSFYYRFIHRTQHRLESPDVFFCSFSDKLWRIHV